MRNAFVVLVTLCIGLVSGFIVPLSGPEHSSHSSEAVKSTTASTKSAELPQKRDDIDGKDLYEHAAVKQNNQNERAFIYISQKYKKPIRNKIIKMPSLDWIEQGHSYVTPASFTNAVRTPCPITFDSRSSNSYFQGYDLPDKQPLEMESYFASPNIFRCNFKADLKKYKVSEKLKTQVPMPNRPDERRDYFELLKPPILRPVNRVNSKKTYDRIGTTELHSISPSITTYKENDIKQYNFNNEFFTKIQTANGRDEMRKNYVFDRSHVAQPVFDNKLLPGAEEVSIDGVFMNDEDSQRLYESDPEEDKLLDKYLQDTLEEQAPSNDKVTNTVECSYRDCVLKSSEQYNTNGMLMKPECKCIQRLNIKQHDPFIVRDRSLREETKRNDTTPSSEVNYYEKLLNEGSSLIKLENDIIKSANKLNRTMSN